MRGVLFHALFCNLCQADLVATALVLLSPRAPSSPGVLTGVHQRGQRDDPGGPRGADPRQQQAGEEEVRQVVDAQLHLQAVLGEGARARHNTYRMKIGMKRRTASGDTRRDRSARLGGE